MGPLEFCRIGRREGDGMDAGVAGDKASQPCEISGRWPLPTAQIGAGVAGEGLGAPRL